MVHENDKLFVKPGLRYSDAVDIFKRSHHLSPDELFKNLLQGCFRCGNTNKYPLTTENPTRFVSRPIKYPKIWEMYGKAISSFWILNEIDFSQDLNHWNERLNEDEKHF